MHDRLLYQTLADTVLALHVAFVAFVIAGLILIVAGNLLGWRWVNVWWFRLLHLAAIVTVVAESWGGMICPLTTFEMWLRARAHEPVYGGDFVEHWLQRILYYDAPPWVFTTAYTLFAIAVVAAWWRFPPRRGSGRPARGG